MHREEGPTQRTSKTDKLLSGILATIAILSLLAVCCGLQDPFEEQDAFCQEMCERWHPDAVVNDAEWHGKDDAMGIERCACYVETEDGWYTIIHFTKSTREIDETKNQMGEQQQ